jgi:hypothetical protein
MGSQRRVSADHVAAVLQRERALEAELFRPHTDAEKRQIEADRMALDRRREAIARAQANPQIPLGLELAQ